MDYKKYLEEIEKYRLNREAAMSDYQDFVNKGFDYDVNQDELYQQAAAQYAKQGKLAMKDTMGQAAAMTGGYGNSYAQTAGQQVYNAYMDEATDIIPEYYDRALANYTNRKDELLSKISLTDTEYNDLLNDMEFDSYIDQGMQSTYSGRGKYTKADNTEADFDNGKYSDYQIRQLQDLLGIEANGYWDANDEATKAALESGGFGSLDEAMSYYMGGSENSTDSGITYTRMRHEYVENPATGEAEKLIVYLGPGGKEYKFAEGVNPYFTGSTSFGDDFPAGMPQEIDGQALTPTDTIDKIGGIWQRVYQTPDGTTKYIWDARNNKLLKYVDKEEK